VGPPRSFDAAVAAGIVTAEQAARLSAFYGEAAPGIAAEPSDTPKPAIFDLAHVLWYAGALIVMGAMGLFSTLAFNQMGPGALIATALVYAAAFTAGGHYLWVAKNLRTPGGLLVTVAVAMPPLAVFGLQDWLGWWGRTASPASIGTSSSGSEAAGCRWSS
jgi:hypothetical protein